MNEFEAKAILLCDTQPVTIEGVRGLLSHCSDLRLAGAIPTLDAAFELTLVLNPAAVVIDKSFGAIAITHWLHRFGATAAKAAPVIWGLGINEAEALRFLQSGARGVLGRTSESETLVTCLRSVTAGNTWLDEGIFGDLEISPYPRRSPLTPRELEIASLVEKGLRNRDIARNLGIQTGTVKIHLKHIFEKAGVGSRYSLALNGLREKGTLATNPCGSGATVAKTDDGERLALLSGRHRFDELHEATMQHSIDLLP